MVARRVRMPRAAAGAAAQKRNPLLLGEGISADPEGNFVGDLRLDVGGHGDAVIAQLDVELGADLKDIALEAGLLRFRAGSAIADAGGGAYRLGDPVKRELASSEEDTAELPA